MNVINLEHVLGKFSLWSSTILEAVRLKGQIVAGRCGGVAATGANARGVKAFL
jgi:hypothetical protein